MERSRRAIKKHRRDHCERLKESESGQLIALMDADRLGQLRTGATTAVAVGCMAAPEASEVGLIGTGTQARGQLAHLKGF